jgi:hypothetical protein
MLRVYRSANARLSPPSHLDLVRRLPSLRRRFGQGFESLPIFLRHGNRNMASLAGIHIAYDADLPSVSAGGDLALEAVFQCTL